MSSLGASSPRASLSTTTTAVAVSITALLVAGSFRALGYWCFEDRQKGMKQEKLEIAEHMLSKFRLDMKTVSEATGLSEEELMTLQEELSK